MTRVGAATGRRGGFSDYLAAHEPELLRLATVVTGDAHTAPDIVQSVLERAYRRWDRIAALDRPDAYLRRMIVNEAVSAWRRVSRLVPTERTPEPPPAADGADEQALRHVLIAEIRKLPPRQRAVLALRYYEDLSDAQIAAALGCTESTVRGYAFRALRTLRVDVAHLDGRTEES